ncbi:cytochrome c oxidase subunit II [Novosphingobium sp. FGD1]|jgi:cytochrome c oxidase subunit 2|uniref:Cytochrome c oxidase subunit 2 n=1 Tax=Novosphingobium silvae TaxID=2692619 RepID=A0A7X4K832_9SPHN|nr:cytochrome c oxidase subunit II [Novosphingobium silvae]MYL98859.1 cytochrome c oxidase subunit II [Novosphingobium silvae]
MTFGKYIHAPGRAVASLGLAAAAALTASVPAFAQNAASSAPAAPSALATGAAEGAALASGTGSYTPMKPVEGVGMPVDGGIGLQTQYSKLGEYGAWIHDGILMPIITIICILVLVLLVIIAVRFNRRANPVASKTSHNTLLEVVWTLVPVLILIGIAVPSIDLIAKQYKPAPEGALTIKVTGNQWFWTYGYPDNGDFEVISNMLNIPGSPTINNGVREVGSRPWDGPAHLEVDNRMVVPVGEPIRLQVTAADVIHSLGVPSLWLKIDAVPGRINEKVLVIEKPGVYYGQCSELCGAKHAYMPIAIEALPRAQYNAWVLTHAGGEIDGQKKPAAVPAAAPAAAPAADASEAPAGEATAEAE